MEDFRGGAVKNESNRYVTRITIDLTLFLFIVMYGLMVKAGVSDVWHLFSFLIVSYLVL